MRVLKAAVAIGAAAVTMLGARAALAGNHGVVFIHGTSDQAPGSYKCTGSGTGTVCNSAANGGYWNQAEIDSVRKGRPYAVVSYLGATCSPWATGGEYGVTDAYGMTGSCANPSGKGNADVIASQIGTFLTSLGAGSDIVVVTHSGGSNYIRYILQNYTKGSFSTVKNATKRVITVAGTTLGTYLANEATNGTITSFIAGIAGYGGEGVAFIRTDHMQTYNASSGFFGGINNPVGGVNVYSTGGLSANTCVGVKLFGACIGVTVNSLGMSTCDSALDDAGLQILNSLYLNANDSSTARNNCSDGFISCMGSQRLGNDFSYATKQDHNQSRRTCNGLDVAIRNMVSGAESGFSDQDFSSHVAVQNADACWFTQVSREVVDSNNNVHGWGQGCSAAMLGNGHCDWDCVAMYGQDAKPTWNGSIVTAWGANDCADTTDGAGNISSTNSPWTDANTYSESGTSYVTSFTGVTGQVAGQSTVWYTDPFWTQTTVGPYSVAGFCPSSWIADGVCDECVLALYGADGNDCLPGHATACGGVLALNNPATSGPNTPIYNETDPSHTSNHNFGWYPNGSPGGFAAVSNNGFCEDTECGQGTASATGMTSTSGITSQPTAQGTVCTDSSQCPGNIACNTSTGYCYACSTSGLTCNSSTYGWTGGTCNTSNGNCYATASITTAQCNSSSDCLSGSTCVSGGCVTTKSPANTDCTAVYNVTPKTCASHADCTGNACVPTGGTCSASGWVCKTTADCSGGSDTCNGATNHCLLTGETCSGDSSCSVPSGATSECSGGACTCSSSTDCAGGATCTNPGLTTGSCGSAGSTSLCR